MVGRRRKAHRTEEFKDLKESEGLAESEGLEEHAGVAEETRQETRQIQICSPSNIEASLVLPFPHLTSKETLW